MANAQNELEKLMKALAAEIGLVLDATSDRTYTLRVDDEVTIENANPKTIRNHLLVLRRYHEAMARRRKPDRRGAIAHTKAKKAKASSGTEQ